MKRILTMFLLTGCVTPSMKSNSAHQDNIFQLGDVETKLTVGTTVELMKEDWQQTKVGCVTHIYSCEVDSNGKVSEIQALDLSSTDFQNFTEEALRAWQFEPGKPGRAFVQYAYERDRPAHILILSEQWARQLADNLAKNRADLPAKDGKIMPKKLTARKPDMPREAALRGIEGFTVYHFQIDEQGAPQNPVLLRSYPEGIFEEASWNAIRRWRYASLKDEPNSQRHSTVTIEFRLVGMNHVSSCDYGFERHKPGHGSAASTFKK